MERHRLVLAISITFTALTAVLWDLSVAGSGSESARHTLLLDVGGAIAASMVAAVCWGAFALLRRDDGRCRMLAAEYQRREAAILKTAAYAARVRTTGPIPTPPFPVPRLRSVR